MLSIVVVLYTRSTPSLFSIHVVNMYIINPFQDHSNYVMNMNLYLNKPDTQLFLSVPHWQQHCQSLQILIHFFA